MRRRERREPFLRRQKLAGYLYARAILLQNAYRHLPGRGKPRRIICNRPVRAL